MSWKYWNLTSPPNKPSSQSMRLYSTAFSTSMYFGHTDHPIFSTGSESTTLEYTSSLCLLAALAFAGMGLLIASRARTTEGVSGLMNLVMLPMWIFSGVFFSSSNFPASVQPIIRLLPLTAVNDALRANMLEGASLSAVSGQMLVIVGWLVLSFVAALKLFRWR